MTSRDHANNFDLLRLVAATSVIFSHAFLLSQGYQSNEPLVLLTGQAVFGLLGVFVFFVISGFLVTASYDNTRSLPRFLMKRALRIYPGLAVCLLFCALVIGTAVTVLPVGDYLRQPGVYRFVVMNLLMKVAVNSLPAVKFTHFGVGGIVNGPLWSLPFELAMYGMVAVLGRLGLLRPRVIVALWVIGVAAALYDTSQWRGTHWQFIGGFLWLLGCFTAGMAMRKLQGEWLHDRRLALLSLIGLVVGAHFHALIGVFPIFGAFLVIHLALDPRLPRVPAARYGDLSYGLYIYGWPVEQTILWLAGGKLPWWGLFLLALPAAAALAYVSWHGIERPALSLKPRPVLRRRSV